MPEAEAATLCMVCQESFYLSLVAYEPLNQYQPTLSSLQKSVFEGCRFCLLVEQRLKEECEDAPEDVDMKMSTLSTPGPYIGEIMIWYNNESSEKWLSDPTKVDVFTFEYLPLIRGAITMFDVENSSESLICQQQSKNWLNLCINEHGDCCEPDTLWYPTRLLRIDSSLEPWVCYLEDSSTINPDGPYVTLSHCWGPSPSSILTLETLASMKSGKAISEFPKTFRDAIKVACWLKASYIWIDSCCIIQDSLSDWETESAMMADVYKSAMCNIVANRASNSSIGFFNERNPLLSTPIFLNIPGHDHILCLPMTTELQESMQREPVMTRAWALQERLLSSRNLHFTEHQIYWECMKLTACETFPEGLLTGKDKFGRSLRKLRALKNDDSDVLDPLQNVERIYQIWFRVCEGYSRCFLTKETDKLVAISGIATHFQRRLHNLGSPDVYLAGLWRSRLIKNLLWYVESDMDGRAIQSNSESSRRPSDYRAPSWSWLSLDGLVHPGYDTDRENFQVFIRILNAQVDLASSNPTGQLKGGAITLQGLLRQAGWKYTKRSRGSSIKLVFDGKVEGQFCDGPVETLDGHGIGTCYPDIDTGFEVEMLHCLIVGGRNTANGPIVYGLLLRQTTTANEYLRVGYFWLRGNGPCNALKYKLRRPDQAAAFPWGRLSLERKRNLADGARLLSFQADPEDGYSQPDNQGQAMVDPMDIYKDDGTFNEAAFERLKVQTITII